VITTSHDPIFVSLERSNVQVTPDEEDLDTFVAEILSSPERRNRAVRLDMKSDPVISIITVAPASPSSGSIFRIDGFAEEVSVVVAATVKVVVMVVILAVVTAVVTVTGAAVGTDSTATWVIFIVYTFSSIARVVVTVA
jgi:hypothetical protein